MDHQQEEKTKEIKINLTMDEIVLIKEAISDLMKKENMFVYRSNANSPALYNVSVKKLRNLSALKDRLDKYGYGYDDSQG